MSNPDLEFVVTAEAAEHLQVSTRQIARMVKTGKLTPAFKANGVRGAYLFDRSQIEALAQGDAK